MERAIEEKRKMAQSVKSLLESKQNPHKKWAWGKNQDDG